MTVLKFLSDCRCRGTLLNTCHDTLARISPDLQGMFDCTAAFSSPYAAVLGLPLTAYAAALYAVALVLGLVAARGGPAAARAADWLLGLALLDVAASAVLFAISTWVLEAWCLFCFCMYFISASLLAGSALARRGGRPRPRAPAGRVLPVQLVVFGLAVVAVQAVPYAARCDMPEAGCLRPVPPPPDTPLVLGAADPDVVLGVVFDPTCSACADEFVELRALVAADPGVAVRFFHYPRELGACGLPGVEIPAHTLTAVNGRACDLSLAIACIGERPGAAADDGIAALAAAFAAFDMRPASARLAAVVDPFLSDDFPRRQLDRCLRERKGAPAEQLAAHLRYGAALDVRGTPTIVVVPVQDGTPQWPSAQVLPGRGGELLREAIAAARRMNATP